MNRWMNFMTKVGSRMERDNHNAGLALLGGIGLGAGLMYLFDPNRGRRRRAMLRDAINHATHVANRAAGTTARDISHRAKGLWAESSRLLTREEEVSDEALTARVRSKLGRKVSHPHAIEVTAREGHVTLSGDILSSEANDLLTCVAKVRGVHTVQNQLITHDQPDGVSSLQGGRERKKQGFGLRQSNWPPTMRLLAGMTGGALLTYSLKSRDYEGGALGTVGFLLLVRGLTNMDLKSLVGIGRDCDAIEVRKTININAPVGQVFEFWKDYRNFPRFLSNVREVKPLGNRRSQWTVVGPAGVPFTWTAEITQSLRNELLAWRTVPGATVGSEGTVHFESGNNGGTRIHIRLCYHPPGGMLGHTVAKLFGADPKSEMDTDLVRMKTLIETGHAPHDAAQSWPAERGTALARVSGA